MNRAKKTKMTANSKATSFKHQGNASTNPYRPDPSGGKPGSQFRTRATINRLNMYNSKPDMEKRRQAPTDPKAGRIQPDRRWFGNVRSVD
jgi:nuclear GTP-binding protein